MVSRSCTKDNMEKTISADEADIYKTIFADINPKSDKNQDNCNGDDSSSDESGTSTKTF